MLRTTSICTTPFGCALYAIVVAIAGGIAELRAADTKPDDILRKLGMEAGLLESVRDRTPLGDDREAFYQLLAAVGRADSGWLLRLAQENLSKIPDSWRWTDRRGREQYSVVPLFNEPASQRGRLVVISGTARRVVEIRLGKEDQDIIDRFGFDNYYMVSLITDDSQSNPLTFCIRELPAGMPYGNLPRYGETVRIAGVFFKTWSYTVLKPADEAPEPGDPKTGLQLSPLLIGRSLTWYPVAKPADTTSSTIVIGSLLVVLMIVVWLAAWRSRRREKKWLEQMESPPKLDSGIELDQVGRSAGGPDFSRMEKTEGPGFRVQGLEPDKPPSPSTEP